MKIFDASQWVLEVNQEEKEFLLELPENHRVVDIEVRSSAGVILNAVSDDGEIIFLDSGNHVRFAARLRAVKALEIVCTSSFAYVANTRRGKWVEIVDPTPLAVTDVQKPEDNMKTMIRDEVRRMMATRQAQDMLKDDASLEELLDDYMNGDLEFEEEDEFGFGDSPYMEDEEPIDEPPPPPEPKETKSRTSSPGPIPRSDSAEVQSPEPADDAEPGASD